MKVVAQEPWSWTLLEDADACYLSVLCGGIAMFGIDIRLTTEELGKFGPSLHGAATDLANLVRANQEEYGERHLGDFSTRPDVRLAGLRWRKEHRAEA